MKSTAEIREKFLEYFKKQGHRLVPSSPTVPHDDPSLLFINAGMNQFKDVFLGQSARDYTRAATSQKCIRVGGKHNDLENVGHTKRHLTFFEMLGNFSFGDYFKKEAVQFCWEVSTEIFGFDPKKLWPTVYLDDDEAFELWKQYVPEERITRMGEKDNFWAMGDTGPCGPCSEIYYDRGPDYGTAANLLEDEKQERFLEFWNLVFMQYNRSPSGIMEPLPKASIDTGSGIERVISLIQDVDSVFDTDVLRALIAQVENISGKKYRAGDVHLLPAFHVIADHLRGLAFAIADGAQPGNVERGYVLRKVLRRAVRYGRKLDLDEPFLAKVLPRLIGEMGDHYPELKTAEDRISEILTWEEEAFLRTLHRGGALLNQIVDNAADHGNRICGGDAFKLKDTYGLPIEEILLLAKDSGLHVDMERYHDLELEARERSRAAQKGTEQLAVENLFTDYIDLHGPCAFSGYEERESEGRVTAIVCQGNYVEELQPGQEGIVVLDRTPFYAELGGQVGDTGVLRGDGVLFEVFDTESPFRGVIAHIGKAVEGPVRKEMSLHASIDAERRQKIANNHTATHLLHWALQQVLGPHIRQAGSVVEAKRLRFDFNHHKALTLCEIKEIENLVNKQVRDNHSVQSYEIGYDEAQKNPEIKQFFGEKYGSRVRVVDLGVSKELCGGTHTQAAGNIGYFRISREGSIAAGVRRIEGVTGTEADAYARQFEQELAALAESLKIQPSKVLERVDRLTEENKLLSQQLNELKAKEMRRQIEAVIQKARTIDGVSVLISEVSVSSKDLRQFVDHLASRLDPSVIILACADDGKAQLIAKVSVSLVEKGMCANELIKILAPIIQGGGGGKPDSAQAGGAAPQNIPEALRKAEERVQQQLSADLNNV